MPENNANYVPYADDTPHSLFVELQGVEQQVRDASVNLRTTGLNAINRKNEYEALKNSYLVQMALEESHPDFKGKRTDMIRTSLYREKFHVERTSWTYAEREFEIAQSHLKALQGLAMSIQSRAKLFKIADDFE